ncbi:iron complex outermembrane receptor protein/outer membrane receptor for ferrienterochelin and colicins [Chitinophaga dinghuensis]|uniref:Iron complex outermembrane receptor protein/outer membrane receptor for ferrienterochelin and colicins n=1 Tax=Chitinophaga dinghuensis TaxID=1539050 RepID=A0A327W0S6_9BACT|nr:TonB-dependent receptor [Chitinophaga dinghuensis]RAJ81846.1 iron complex outermembrane receptor protein/outer membrane receptor for ferrienterochelin and colicins [Chitinophaga dinghuensis]
MKFLTTAAVLCISLSAVAQQDTTAPKKDTISSVKELEGVTISSTRNNSRIENLPMKVEVLGKEEMIEEASIKPGNVASILGDLSVIHIQNTSAVSGNNAIRMQGLDGKYTQLLRDGLPLYEGLSGNFGVLAIPPLDLKQIEIIKGSVSTLYGGGAIAGMINFISKTPTNKPELTLLANGTTLKEKNFNAYYAQKWGKFGMTFFGGLTSQNPVDVNNDGFSDVPRVRQYIVHPRFFWYLNPNSTIQAGYTGTFEKREGGDMQVLDHHADNVHTYTEINNSNRNSVDLQYTQRNLGGGTLTVKGNGSFYNLTSTEGPFVLDGRQVNTYAEASYNKKAGRNDMVFGLNNNTENYQRGHGDSSTIGNYNYQTIGAFVQDGFHISDKWLAEAGLRADHHNVFGWYVLPRLALMYKPTDDLSIRLSAGTGYKSPAIFTTQTQTIGYRYLLPLGANVKSERSTGINFDGNYRTNIGELELTLNQAFYYTHITDPILPVQDMTDPTKVRLENQPYAVNSLGTDTYVRMEWNHVELYLGYNHTISRYTDAAKTNVPFAPQDKFASTLAYTIEDKWRFGIENSWIGSQYLYNNEKAPNYWFWAAMISRKIGDHVTLVLNGENLFDARQGKNAPLWSGSISNPTFQPLWGPIDGRVVNFSVKFDL